VRLITLYLPEPYIRTLDALCQKELYPNRATAIRVAIHDLIVLEQGKILRVPNEVCPTCGRRFRD
jgi:antitoxin ParD1/3/4